jgi:hypothetical protein
MPLQALPLHVPAAHIVRLSPVHTQQHSRRHTRSLAHQSRHGKAWQRPIGLTACASQLGSACKCVGTGPFAGPGGKQPGAAGRLPAAAHAGQQAWMRLLGANHQQVVHTRRLQGARGEGKGGVLLAGGHHPRPPLPPAKHARLIATAARCCPAGDTCKRWRPTECSPRDPRSIGTALR